MLYERNQAAITLEKKNSVVLMLNNELLEKREDIKKLTLRLEEAEQKVSEIQKENDKWIAEHLEMKKLLFKYE